MLVSMSIINWPGTADWAAAPGAGTEGVVRTEVPPTAKLFGLLLLGAFLYLLLNSGLQGTQPHVHTLPKVRTERAGQRGWQLGTHLGLSLP